MIACQGWHCTWNYRIWQNHSQGAVLDVTGWYTLDIGNAEFFEHGMILHSGPERAHVFLLVLQFYAEAYCILLHVPGSKTKVTKGSQVCNMMQHSMVRRRRVSRRFPPRLSSRPDWLWWAKIKEGRKSSLDQVNTPSYTLALASKKCFGRFQHWGKLDPPQSMNSTELTLTEIPHSRWPGKLWFLIIFAFPGQGILSCVEAVCQYCHVMSCAFGTQRKGFLTNKSLRRMKTRNTQLPSNRR